MSELGRKVMMNLRYFVFEIVGSKCMHINNVCDSLSHRGDLLEVNRMYLSVCTSRLMMKG